MNRRRPFARLALPAAAALAIIMAVLSARQPAAPPPDPAGAFVVRDEMIPMRDGVTLFTKIFTPKHQTGPLPFVFRRTPYGIDGAAGSFVRCYQALADEGYIFVFQDIRAAATARASRRRHRFLPDRCRTTPSACTRRTTPSRPATA